MKENTPQTFTCIVCKDKIYCLPNGEFHTCKCGKTSIDHADFYTRFIGLPPLEQIHHFPEIDLKQLCKK